MKMTLFALALTFSSTVFARQYIQCSTKDAYSTDVAVVNLTTEKATLFISSGMQNPEDERTLVNISFDKKENGNLVYKLEGIDGFVTVPSKEISKSSNYVEVNLQFNSYYIEYTCFSRIYND